MNPPGRNLVLVLSLFAVLGTSRDARAQRPPLRAGDLEGEPGAGRSAAAFADRARATSAKLALAWLLARKPWIVPIPGTTKLDRLEENLGSVDVELAAGALSAIDEASSSVIVQGARYPEFQERLTGR